MADEGRKVDGENHGPGRLFLRHDNREFIDDTIHLVGHAYFNCSFIRCTFIVKDGVGTISGGTMTACVWNIDMVVHDEHSFDAIAHILSLVRASLLSETTPEGAPIDGGGSPPAQG